MDVHTPQSAICCADSSETPYGFSRFASNQRPASAVLADTNATYTPGLSERRGSTSKFLHSDALGTTRGITNSSQTSTDGLLFDAFGMSVSRTGTTPTPFGFVGASQYQTDGDSGLMLLGHRYYDASIGRFISIDPIQDGDNWYAYSGNNPLQEIDPKGLRTISISLGGVIQFLCPAAWADTGIGIDENLHIGWISHVGSGVGAGLSVSPAGISYGGSLGLGLSYSPGNIQEGGAVIGWLADTRK